MGWHMRLLLLCLCVFSNSMIVNAADSKTKELSRKPASGEFACFQKWLEIKPVVEDSSAAYPEKSLVDDCDVSKPFSVAHKKDTSDIAKPTKNTPYNVWVVCCTAK